MKQKIISAAVVALLFGFYAGFLMHKVNLVTADLGRHIRNGEYLFQDAKVLSTNFYSYTQPGYPDINHHWGSGLIFYLLEQAGGITSVHLFFIILSLGAFALFFFTAVKQSSLAWASLAALPMIFLLGERTEIRPEVFSYFFAGLFLWLLYKFRAARRHYKLLFFLPVLEVLWANTHIYFILGPMIAGAFLLEALITKRENARRLLIIFILTVLATLLNPAFIKGAVEPLIILRAFGYRLAENQTVLFMLKLSVNPALRIFIAVFALMVLSFIPALHKLRKNYPLVNIFLFAGFSFLAWFQIRNIAFFAFVALPILAFNLKAVFGEARETSLFKISGSFLAVILVIALSGNLFHYFPYWYQFGLGTELANNTAAEFFKRQKIRGPIFNNYDIGGYLIYHLFSQTRVFVDNRPEAYSVDFFQKEYIPMQQDEAVWKTQNEKYKFNAIVFSHRDATPWGQAFLSQRVKDPQWSTVFLDQYVIILVRK